MNSLRSKLIEISDNDFLIVYKMDTIDSTYSEVLRIDIDFLADNEYCIFFEAKDMFDSVKKYLMPGTYFSVYRTSCALGGKEWWAEVVLPKDE